MGEKLKEIEIKSRNEATIINKDIELNCFFENTMFGGLGTLIIDEDFINDMINIAENIEFQGNLVTLLSKINNDILKYFQSNEKNNLTREKTYEQNLVIDKDGMALGTKISSLKGKNVALCSEKSIAAYIILNHLFNSNKISRKPSLILSNLGTDTNENDNRPHAFITIDRDSDRYPFKHILWDIQNPTELEDNEGNHFYFTGLYGLSDEDKKDIELGNKCKPISLYEIIGNYKDVDSNRVYGNKEKELLQKI